MSSAKYIPYLTVLYLAFFYIVSPWYDLRSLIGRLMDLRFYPRYCPPNTGVLGGWMQGVCVTVCVLGGWIHGGGGCCVLSVYYYDYLAFPTLSKSPGLTLCG